MKLYLAGPMSGIPKFNYPAFFEAAELLRDQGHEVVSPAEMDSEANIAVSMASEHGYLSEYKDSWGTILAEDVRVVADEVDGVVMLEGWPDSRGARMEAFVAATVGKPVYELEELHEIPVQDLMDVISFGVRYQGDTSRYTEEK